MKVLKKIIPSFVCKKGLAIIKDNGEDYYSENAVALSRYYSDNGADALLLRDCSEDVSDHEQTIGLFKEIGRNVDVPLIVGGQIRQLEDVKKYLYAGAASVFLDMSREDNVDLLKEASNRFGTEKIYAYINSTQLLKRAEEFAQLGASAVVLELPVENFANAVKIGECPLPVLLMNDDDSIGIITSCLKIPSVTGVVLTVPGEKEGNSMAVKQELKARGIRVDVLESAVEWEDLKLERGQIPVIVQDCRTKEVLMLAHMNKEAFEATISTGRMAYSRICTLPVQTDSDGAQLQYVKSLTLNCNRDILLAKVVQIGSVCHTGTHSCFFQPVLQRDYKEGSHLRAFEEVYQAIRDRKAEPREESYASYLFDKGLDKILKKVGEDATGIIIASKNPNPEEIKVGISDMLYHIMILMAEKGINWEEVTEELLKK